MMYHYMTLADETEIVHSHLKKENGIKTVEVHFERPKLDGFDSIRCSLPSYEWTVWEGHYSDDEIKNFEQMLRTGAHIIYKYAELGGAKVAKNN